MFGKRNGSPSLRFGQAARAAREPRQQAPPRIRVELPPRRRTARPRPATKRRKWRPAVQPVPRGAGRQPFGRLLSDQVHDL